jgi:hypothetical protein
MKTIWVVTDKETGNFISVFKAKCKAQRFFADRLDEVTISKCTWNGGYYCTNPAEVFTGFMDAIENKRFSDMF